MENVKEISEKCLRIFMENFKINVQNNEDYSVESFVEIE